MFTRSGDAMLTTHRLIKTGTLDKLNRKGKRTSYTFMLFADKLCYGERAALNKGRARHRINRVIQLETCSVRQDAFELQKLGMHGFLLQSPVKSFLACGKTKEDSQQWFEAIDKAIKERTQICSNLKKS